ncbi:phosphatase and actin regulator 2-like isoform X1 [Protopterus annectens]|uniref:phosphatase and actin regulator 2-like isoform X1 n=1 Tax=Protopterus annectens TaxID=7888 RepID=UPI001CF9C2F3|nr:phosphatase and actin regulator 2-like isoform X1 [Protopterus annectens]
MGQTSVSTLSQQDNGVDGLDKASVTNTEEQTPGSHTPSLKRRGKLSSLGKIFKPWKWRKKKTSEKFRETSAVLERKISTRQSREELIRRGVLKEIADQDGDITINQETLNGHTVSINVEPVAEVKTIENIAENGSTSIPPTVFEEKAESKQGCTEKQPDPATEAPPPPKPKSKKALMPPRTGSASAVVTSTIAATTAVVAAHKTESGTGKKSAKSGSGKQPPVPPPKPTSRNLNRAAATSSHPKKTTSSKTTSQSPSQSSSSRSKASKDRTASKVTTSEHSKVSKEADKQPEPAALRIPDALPVTSVSGQEPQLEKKEVPKQLLNEQQNLLPSLPQDLQNHLGSLPNTPDSTCTSKPAPNTEQCLSPQAEQQKHWKANSGSEGNTSSLDGSAEEKTPSESKSHVFIGDCPSISVIPDDESKRSFTSDSDSDGPVLYTDDDEDDDDESYTEGSLACKIRRRDTLAIKLGNRPSKKELEDKNILPCTSEEERQELRQQIGTKLVRRLSQRPTTEELEQRNILKQKNEAEEQEVMKEIKRQLSRKLSVRPTVAELQARRILRFNEYVEVLDIHDYDRRADKPWARLTPADKAAIRKELNEFKSTEMEVHEESRQFTRFHRP